jgi:hypothetical protein
MDYKYNLQILLKDFMWVLGKELTCHWHEHFAYILLV